MHSGVYPTPYPYGPCPQTPTTPGRAVYHEHPVGIKPARATRVAGGLNGDILGWALGYPTAKSMWLAFVVSLLLASVITWGGLGIMIALKSTGFVLDANANILNFIVGLFAPVVLGIEVQSKLMPILQFKGVIEGCEKVLPIHVPYEKLSDSDKAAYLQRTQSIAQIRLISRNTSSVMLMSDMVLWVVILCHLFGQGPQAIPGESYTTSFVNRLPIAFIHSLVVCTIEAVVQTCAEISAHEMAKESHG